MKKSICLFVFVMLFSVSAKADIYLSAGLGKNFNENEAIEQGNLLTYEDDVFYSGAVGYDLPVLPIRGELEALYAKENAKNTSDSVDFKALMLNGYARIPVIGLYGGLGVGYGSVEHKETPVYQGMVGVEYGLLGLNLGLEMRHLESSKDVTFFKNDKYEANMVMLKLRYEF